MNKKRTTAWGLFLVILLTFMWGTTAYASEEQTAASRLVEPVSQDMELYYTDLMGIRHSVTFHVEGAIEVEWSDGYAGWVNALILNISNARIDGAPVSCGLGTSSSNKSICNFTINNQIDIVTVKSACDEWGDYDIWAVLNL